MQGKLNIINRRCSTAEQRQQMAKQLIKKANNLAQINKHSHKIITKTNARAADDVGIELKRNKKPNDRERDNNNNKLLNRSRMNKLAHMAKSQEPCRQGEPTEPTTELKAKIFCQRQQRRWQRQQRRIGRSTNAFWFLFLYPVTKQMLQKGILKRANFTEQASI